MHYSKQFNIFKELKKSVKLIRDTTDNSTMQSNDSEVEDQ